MGRIELCGMKFFARHGCLESEREQGNEFTVDFACDYDTSFAERSDDLSDTLDYSRVFDDTFAHYLKSYENAGVKTTGMGSMFRLSFKIRMKNPAEEKELIDELLTKNGNLEISILPYTEPQNQL